MPKSLSFQKVNVSNPKVWIVIGVTIAGIVILAETRRRRLISRRLTRQDFCAFIENFELIPFPQPPPPAARLPLSDLTFAISDNIEVKDHSTGFGNPDWKKTHEAASMTAVVVTALLKNGATCVGKTVMAELGYGITGENVHYGSPINPHSPSHVPGGSSSGSSVAVSSELVDFSLGTDTIGCVRVPASFCGILGYRPSHGIISSLGILPSSQSLDTIGWFARNPSVLHRVGHVLLQLNQLDSRRIRRFIVADDLFQLTKIPKQRTVHILGKVTEKLSGYQLPTHINFVQYIAANVPSLNEFCEKANNQEVGMSTVKALSSVMILLHRYEFQANHEAWIKSHKPKMGYDLSVLAAPTTTDDIKILYKVRTEMRAALKSLLKDDSILVIPTVLDHPLKLKSKKSLLTEFRDRAFALSSIASMSGCCQVTVPLGKYEDFPISVSLVAQHGADKFLLDTVLDMYSSLQEQISFVSESVPLPDTNGNMETSELLKEKGNDAFKRKQWNKAVSYYSDAIKLTENATYFCNRAAAFLELGCFREAEIDCNMAISLDKKNVKAYLRRGTARESLLFYKEALKDFKHAIVLEPQNKVAKLAEKRLQKLIS